MASVEAGQTVTRGKPQRRRVDVRITKQIFCRELRSSDGGVKVSLINYSWNMISGFQSTNVFCSKYFLQPFDILSTELSRLVPFKM
jgi:hypothetical protein